MLDPNFVRHNPDSVRDRLSHRGIDPTQALEELARLESSRRRVILELEELKRQQNASSEEVARAKRQGLDTATRSRPSTRSSL